LALGPGLVGLELDLLRGHEALERVATARERLGVEVDRRSRGTGVLCLAALVGRGRLGRSARRGPPLGAATFVPSLVRRAAPALEARDAALSDLLLDAL